MNCKRIIVFVIVLGMMAGRFSYKGTSGNVKGAVRHQVISVENITVVHNPNEVVDGIYRNGNFRLNVSFGLADSVDSVNVTWNITHIGSGSSEVDTVNIGNLNAGNHFSVNAHLFDFSVVGNYSINATVWGNHNGSNISTSLVQTFHFENQARYELNFEVHPLIPTAETGEYNIRGLPITGSITNKGNYDISQTTVAINVTGDSEFIGMLNPVWREVGFLLTGGKHENIQFVWSPTREGNYTVNITAHDNMSGGSNFTTFDVKVFNVSYIKIWDIQFDSEVDANAEFGVRVQLNNTGNFAGNTTVTLNILDRQDNVAYTDVSETDEIMATGGGSGLHEINNISIATGGLYKVNVSIPSGSSVEKSLIVRPNGIPPYLHNEALIPDPRETDVNASETVMFYVTYSDDDKNPVTVMVDIDGEKYKMIPSDGIGNPWIDGEHFEYEWTSTEGYHNFSFICTDGMFNVTYEPADHEFNIYHLDFVNGTVRGKVTDEYGNVSGAKVDIYQAELNETGAATGNRINETQVEADENGSYMKVLDFSYYSYIITINETWMAENDYDDVAPIIDIFKINENNLKVWKNFTLVSKPRKIPDTWLNGTVTDAFDKILADVNIIIEIFRDEYGNITIQKEINGTLENITVDITTRTWMNMTATTDANGAYSIRGVPFDIPKITDVTGRKVFRQDLHGIPSTAPEGWWNVIANKTGYESSSQMLQFMEGETTVWNATLIKLGPIRGRIFGIVDPPDASIIIVPEMGIEHNKTTGEFSIAYVGYGEYMITFTATGRHPFTKSVSVYNDSDHDLGDIILDPPYFYSVTVGPFTDKNGDGIPGITVSFILGNFTYTQVTSPDGNAYFELPEPNIPYNTEIILTKGDKTKTYTWPWDESWAFDDDENTEDGKKEKNFLIITIMVLTAVLIMIVGIFLGWIMVFRRKKEKNDHCDDSHELKCPHCRTSVPANLTYCPECGENFLCTECNDVIVLSASVCEACGTELREVLEAMEDEYDGPDEMGRVRSNDVNGKKMKLENPR